MVSWRGSVHTAHGDPAVFSDIDLYVVNVTAGRATMMKSWKESFQGSGTAELLKLDGWMPDDKSVRLSACVCYGSEYAGNYGARLAEILQC